MRTKAYSQEATKLQTDGALPTGPGRGWSDLFVCVTTLIILLHYCYCMIRGQILAW